MAHGKEETSTRVRHPVILKFPSLLMLYVHSLARQFIEDYEPNIAMIPSRFEVLQ